MDETEHMPRYTLTLVDSTGAMEPLILMDDDLNVFRQINLRVVTS